MLSNSSSIRPLLCRVSRLNSQVSSLSLRHTAVSAWARCHFSSSTKPRVSVYNARSLSPKWVVSMVARQAAALSGCSIANRSASSNSRFVQAERRAMPTMEQSIAMVFTSGMRNEMFSEK